MCIENSFNVLPMSNTVYMMECINTTFSLAPFPTNKVDNLYHSSADY